MVLMCAGTYTIRFIDPWGMQATGIALLIPVLLVVLIPLTENARVYFVYQKMDDTVANEYGAKVLG